MSNGRELLYGQQNEPTENITLPFTQQMVDFKTAQGLAGTVGMEIIPHDRDNYLVRAWDEAAIQAEFDAQVWSFPGVKRLFLPPTITDLQLLFNTTSGAGTSSQSSTGGSAGAYASLSLAQRASAQGACAVMPDISFTVQEVWAHNTPIMTYVFYWPMSLSLAQLITKLEALTGASVFSWPAFRTQESAIVLFGGQGEVAANADVTQQVSVSSSNVTATYGTGTGLSYRLGVANKVVRLPSALHGAFDLSATSSVTADAMAEVDMPGGTNWIAQNATETAPTLTIIGTASPTSISATSLTALPTSGLFIADIQAEPYKWGRMRVRVELVDFTFFN